MQASVEVDYDGPPDYRTVGRHALLPNTTHDQTERYNFLAHLNRHLAAEVLPGVTAAYQNAIEPTFRRRHGRVPEDRHEVRRALEGHTLYRLWSALRRNTMEMRQQSGLAVVLGQLRELIERSAALAEPHRLRLDPALKTPRYLTAVDHHCMPGSYYTERLERDVSAAANYDSGLFVTTGGLLGRLADGGGRGMVAFVSKRYPDFAPRRILDLGCGLGHNVLPIAAAFPDAEVTAVDVAAPMLRYGAARAVSLGIHNVTFVQADASNLSAYEDGCFDWVGSIMFLHETSLAALKRIMAESRRLVAPGGLVTHVEQPRYDAAMPLLEQALRDWDAFNNNEPFWTKLHEIDLDQLMVEAGFDRNRLIHDGVYAIAEGEGFHGGEGFQDGERFQDGEGLQDRERCPDAATDEVEDYGRKPAWRITGAEVPA